VRADALDREELCVRSQAEADERNLAREKAQAEITAKNKLFKMQVNNELRQQKLDAEFTESLVTLTPGSFPVPHSPMLGANGVNVKTGDRISAGQDAQEGYNCKRDGGMLVA